MIRIPYCDNGLHDRRELYRVVWVEGGVSLLCWHCFRLELIRDSRAIKEWEKVVSLQDGAA